MIVDDGNDLVALLMFVARVAKPIAPFFGHGVGPVAMEHGEIELLLCSEMLHTGYERLPQRPVIRPFGKDFVDGRVVDGRLAMGVLWYGNTSIASPCRAPAG